MFKWYGFHELGEGGFGYMVLRVVKEGGRLFVLFLIWIGLRKQGGFNSGEWVTVLKKEGGIEKNKVELSYRSKDRVEGDDVQD
jgi:hypothetical protein